MRHHLEHDIFKLAPKCRAGPYDETNKRPATATKREPMRRNKNAPAGGPSWRDTRPRFFRGTQSPIREAGCRRSQPGPKPRKSSLPESLGYESSLENLFHGFQFPLIRLHICLRRFCTTKHNSAQKNAPLCLSPSSGISAWLKQCLQCVTEVGMESSLSCEELWGPHYLSPILTTQEEGGRGGGEGEGRRRGKGRRRRGKGRTEE